MRFSYELTLFVDYAFNFMKIILENTIQYDYKMHLIAIAYDYHCCSMKDALVIISTRWDALTSFSVFYSFMQIWILCSHCAHEVFTIVIYGFRGTIVLNQTYIAWNIEKKEGNLCACVLRLIKINNLHRFTHQILNL